MKLFVMGAGYVGMALLEFFLSQPHEIYITTTRKERVESLRPYGKDVFLLDSAKDKDFHDLVNACDGMVILVAPSNGKGYAETYLDTAKRVCLVLKDRKTPFYLLYTSSTSVCEGMQNAWVTEDMPLNPTTENAKLLLETERLYLNSGAHTCILRLGGIHGPNRTLADRARRFSGKEMPGTGNEPTNNIHRDDIVSAIAFCIDHSLTGIYHLVNDDHRTRKDLYSQLCKEMGIPAPVWNPNQAPLSSHKISNSKIKAAGFVAST